MWRSSKSASAMAKHPRRGDAAFKLTLKSDVKTIAHGPALRHQQSPADRWDSKPAYGWPDRRHVAIGGIGPLFVGSPAQVADTLEAWIDATDADGFNLAYAAAPKTMEDIVELLVPEVDSGTGGISAPISRGRCGRSCSGRGRRDSRRRILARPVATSRLKRSDNGRSTQATCVTPFRRPGLDLGPNQPSAWHWIGDRAVGPGRRLNATRPSAWRRCARAHPTAISSPHRAWSA